jgi:hypothetical protein
VSDVGVGEDAVMALAMSDEVSRQTVPNPAILTQ